MRHRRGNSPLTLSRPISGACHFGPRQSLTTWIASTWRKHSSVEMLRKLKTHWGGKNCAELPTVGYVLVCNRDRERLGKHNTCWMERAKRLFSILVKNDSGLRSVKSTPQFADSYNPWSPQWNWTAKFPAWLVYSAFYRTGGTTPQTRSRKETEIRSINGWLLINLLT